MKNEHLKKTLRFRRGRNRLSRRRCNREHIHFFFSVHNSYRADFWRLTETRRRARLSNARQTVGRPRLIAAVDRCERVALVDLAGVPNAVTGADHWLSIVPRCGI